MLSSGSHSCFVGFIFIFKRGVQNSVPSLAYDRSYNNSRWIQRPRRGHYYIIPRLRACGGLASPGFCEGKKEQIRLETNDHHGEHRLDSETFNPGEKISVEDTSPRRIPGSLGPNLRKGRAGKEIMSQLQQYLANGLHCTSVSVHVVGCFSCISGPSKAVD